MGWGRVGGETGFSTAQFMKPNCSGRNDKVFWGRVGRATATTTAKTDPYGMTTRKAEAKAKARATATATGMAYGAMVGLGRYNRRDDSYG
jgi:hypothetical protein